jgi:hypothetical protein
VRLAALMNALATGALASSSLAALVLTLGRQPGLGGLGEMALTHFFSANAYR